MGEALRFNEAKAKLAYILEFGTPMEALARIMEFGACKYTDGNWRKGGKPDREYLDSMMRHLCLWKQGEDFDQDSGCSHLGHCIWNLCALLELNYSGQVIDEGIFRKQCDHWIKMKLETSHD